MMNRLTIKKTDSKHPVFYDRHVSPSTAQEHNAVDASGILLHNLNVQYRGEPLMRNSQMDFQNHMDVIAAMLIRCFLGGMVLLMVWFAWFAIAGDWIYQVHSRWFQIPRQSFDAIHYAGMAVTKIAIIVFFLLPWIAIKLLLRKKEP